MNDPKKLMINALKQLLTPELRARGFKGSFPHFHRLTQQRADFLTIQFYSSGGSFVVEIAKAKLPIDKKISHGVAVEKVTTAHFRDRYRLRSMPDRMGDDQWFEFGARTYEPVQDQEPERYQNVAARVVPLLHSQAEPWWNAE